MRSIRPLLVLPIVLAACGGAGATAGPSAASPAASASTELVADIDIGGRTLHLVCLGPTDTGEPTILLESGLGGEYTMWGEILLGMQASQRVCAYDRAGLGMSEPADAASRTTADSVADLRALIDAAGLTGPFVVGAHSLGAWTATLFTAAHPDDVAGLVLVDPRGPGVSDAWRQALPAATAGEPESVAANRDELATFEVDPSLNPEHLHLADSAADVVAALAADGPLFGDRPVVVLGGSLTPDLWADLPADLKASFDASWLAGQQQFVDESTAGRLEMVPDSGHDIMLEQPPVVIEALQSVVDAAAGS